MKVALIVSAGLVASASAQVRITEWMYSGNNGEFVEITNLGNSAVDLSGWSYDDDSQTPGVFALSGILAAGESLIFTEESAANFRLFWSLDASVQVLGDVTNNLGRNDQINIYDNNGNLVDRLTYGDENLPGTIRTQNRSGNPGLIGGDDVSTWTLAFIGDGFGSYASVSGDIANPGIYIPTPGTAMLLGLGGMMAARRRR